VRVYPPGEPVVTSTDSPLDESFELVDAKANNGYLKRKTPSSLVDTSGSRRSRRSKSSKDPFTEHKVMISKQDTVMDLKVKVRKEKILNLVLGEMKKKVFCC